jgi:protein-tyrosine phosphatase
MAATSNILLICTANQCRSPMAEALLRRRLGESPDDPAVTVTSAGFLEGGVPCPPDVITVMAEVGIDLSGHRSRRVSADLVDEADLIVTMAKQHSIDLAVEFPSAWRRCFTVSELLGRAAAAGGPAPSQRRNTDPQASPESSREALEAWAARLGAGRQRSDLLRLPSSDDVPDPIGRSLRDFRETRDRLGVFAERLSALLRGNST